MKLEYRPFLRLELEPPYDAIGRMFDNRIWAAETLGDFLRVAAELRAGTRRSYETATNSHTFVLDREKVVAEGLYDDQVTQMPLRSVRAARHATPAV